MSQETGIEWTDATWNPVRGCSRVSEGCRNCYAEAVASRFSGPGLPYEGLEPLHTATAKARFGIVTVTIDGEEWALADIGMRMLEPRELARAQGFPDSYILTGSKAAQVARIGNSVCPPVARAIVETQFAGELATVEGAA